MLFRRFFLPYWAARSSTLLSTILPALLLLGNLLAMSVIIPIYCLVYAYILISSLKKFPFFNLSMHTVSFIADNYFIYVFTVFIDNIFNMQFDESINDMQSNSSIS